MSVFEDQKRMILPFLQRAEEVEKHDPKVAWYCRMHALETALAIPKSARDPRINDLIKSVITTVEKTKAAATISDRDADKAYLEDFALKVFSRADRTDRAGLADKRTAINFLAAFYFFEVLVQFGDLADDVAEKQRYAAWKAADIRKALREGRQPTPGPPHGDGQRDDDELPTPPGFMTNVTATPPATHTADAAIDREDSFGLPAPPQGAHGDAASMAPGSSQAAAGLFAGTGQPELDADASDDFELPDVPGAGGSAAGPSAVQHTHVLPATQGSVQVQIHCRQCKPAAECCTHQSQAALHVEALWPGWRRTGRRCMLPCLTELSTVYGSSWCMRWPLGTLQRTITTALCRAAWCKRWTASTGGNLRDVSCDCVAPTNLPAPTRALPPAPFAAPAVSAGPAGTVRSNDPPSTSPGYPSVAGPPPPPLSDSLPAASQQQTSAQPVAKPPSTCAAVPPAGVGRDPPRGVKGTTGQSMTHQAAVQLPAAVPGYQPSLKDIAEAHKQAKYAVSSLSFEDVPTAVKHLTNALQLLTSPQR